MMTSRMSLTSRLIRRSSRTSRHMDAFPWRTCKWAERSMGEFERYKKDLKKVGYHNFKGSGRGTLKDIGTAVASLVALAEEMRKYVDEHMKEVDVTD